MEKDLAFFGAFNPPTLAHLRLAEFALEKTGARQVLFVPSKSVYILHSQGKDFAYSDAARLRMLEAAAGKRPDMKVIPWETQAPEQPRSYRTLCALREAGYDPVLLIGSDKLAELETWFMAESIFREFGVVCLVRGDDRCESIISESAFLSRMRERVTVIATPDDFRGISSSAVRAKVLRGERNGLSEMVAPEILDLLFETEG